MMKVPITKARVRVTGTFRQDGSVLAQTIQGSCVGIETRLEVESPAAAADVAGVIRNAENGCFTIQAIRTPSPVQTTVSLNGKPLEWERGATSRPGGSAPTRATEGPPPGG